MSERPTGKSTLGRFLLGALAWFVALRIYMLVSGVATATVMYATGLRNPSALTASPARTWAYVTAWIVWSVIGLGVGWWCAGVARVSDLERPSWWAPSLAAVAVALIAGTLFAGLADAVSNLAWGALACVPVLAGQALSVFRRTRQQVAATQDAAIVKAPFPGTRVVWFVGVFLAWPLVASALNQIIFAIADLVPSTPWRGEWPDEVRFSDVGFELLPYAYILLLALVSFLVALLLVRVFGAPRRVWIAMAASGVVTVLVYTAALAYLAAGFTQGFLSSYLVTAGTTDIPVPLVEQLPMFFTDIVGPAVAVSIGAWYGTAMAVRRLARRDTRELSNKGIERTASALD